MPVPEFDRKGGVVKLFRLLLSRKTDGLLIFEFIQKKGRPLPVCDGPSARGSELELGVCTARAT